MSENGAKIIKSYLELSPSVFLAVGFALVFLGVWKLGKQEGAREERMETEKRIKEYLAEKKKMAELLDEHNIKH